MGRGGLRAAIAVVGDLSVQSGQDPWIGGGGDCPGVRQADLGLEKSNHVAQYGGPWTGWDGRDG